jgi:hypothetical protein
VSTTLRRLRHATEAQKHSGLPRLASGESMKEIIARSFEEA